MRLFDIGAIVDELCRSLAVPAMTFAIVVLRGWYHGRKRWPARIVEGVMFGMVAAVLYPVAKYVIQTKFGFPDSIADKAAITFLFAIGYTGADTLSDAAKSYFGGRK